MPKYKKRADGRYCKQIMIGYHPDGRKKVKTFYAQTIRELEDKELKIRRQIEEGENLASDKITVKTWANQWLEVYKKTSVVASTYSFYEHSLNNHIIPKLGNLPITKLKPVHIQSAINELINEGHIRTAEIFRSTIKQIIKKAVEEGLISKNICEGLGKIKSVTKEKRVLSEFEIFCLKNTNYSPREKLFLAVLYFTGIRRGEALALHSDDINLKNRTLTVAKSLDIRDNTSYIKEPKSKAGFRQVFIPDKLCELLTQLIPKDYSGYLFTTKDGKLCTRSSYRKLWQSILKKTQKTADRIIKNTDPKSIPGGNDTTICFTPHTFRHTYATNLYYAGIDIKFCQYLLGHSSLDMTLKIYTHLDSQRSTEKSADKINEFFKKS